MPRELPWSQPSGTASRRSSVCSCVRGGSVGAQAIAASVPASSAALLPRPRSRRRTSGSDEAGALEALGNGGLDVGGEIHRVGPGGAATRHPVGPGVAEVEEDGRDDAGGGLGGV